MAVNQPPASRPPSGTPNGGKITSQVQTTEIGPDNKPTRGVRVSFETGLKNNGSVFIPDAQYNPTNAIAKAREAANRIDSIHEAPI